MQRTKRRREATGVVLAVAAVAVSAGCGNGGASAGAPVGAQAAAGAAAETTGSAGPGGTTPGTGGTTGNSGSDPSLSSNPNIDARKVDYGEALRTATLKLVGALPTLADVEDIANAIATAGDSGEAMYETKLDALLADPRFSVRQIQWWRDTFKTGAAGEPTSDGAPDFDAAATFAAEVVVEDRPYTDLFTATNGTCPTFSDGVFTPADCPGSQPTAGLLTDPGLMAQYYEDMGFRRVRFVQEVFVCNAMPTEFSGSPLPKGSALYTSPWPFDSISGGPTATIDFQSTASIICANCHTTLNHIAPLFAHFDANGSYDATSFQVNTPSPGSPTSQLSDWLPAGQAFAWRFGHEVSDLPSLGAAIAADPAVAQCAVNRIWNYAMSRGDIVNDLATVPPVVTAPLVADFVANGRKVKGLLREAFTSSDYVRF